MKKRKLNGNKKKYSLTLIVGYIVIGLLLGRAFALSANYVTNPSFDKNCPGSSCTGSGREWYAYKYAGSSTDDSSPV
jgi:hypothetical protein